MRGKEGGGKSDGEGRWREECVRRKVEEEGGGERGGEEEEGR